MRHLVTQMTTGNTDIASAINLSQIAQHPDLALQALVEVVRRQEEELTLLQENQGILFGLFAKLKDQITPKMTEDQVDQATVLKALLAAQPNGKMFSKDARQKLRIPKASFSRLLARLKADIEVRQFHADRRRDLLILRSENG
jgi:hypothetical protein